MRPRNWGPVSYQVCHDKDPSIPKGRKRTGYFLKRSFNDVIFRPLKDWNEKQCLSYPKLIIILMHYASKASGFVPLSLRGVQFPSTGYKKVCFKNSSDCLTNQMRAPKQCCLRKKETVNGFENWKTNYTLHTFIWLKFRSLLLVGNVGNEI